MKTLMRNGRDRRSENPFLGHARKERVSLFGTDQRITSGPAATRLHSKAEYMTAPERFADSQIPLAPRAPSIHDPLPPSAIQSSCVAVFLFDQLVRAQQDRCRHIEAKRLGGRHIEHGLVFHRQLHRQIGRLLALKDAVDVGGAPRQWPIWSGPYDSRTPAHTC